MAKRKHPPLPPPYPPTLESAVTQLAAIERQRPGQLMSWLRAQRPLAPRASRAIFVNVVELPCPE